MAERNNLGRGLGDLIQEVADVKAVPSFAAAPTPTPAPAPSAPVLVEERSTDEAIHRRTQLTGRPPPPERSPSCGRGLP